MSPMKYPLLVSTANKSPIYLAVFSAYNSSSRFDPFNPILQVVIHVQYFIVLYPPCLAMHVYLIKLPPELFMLHNVWLFI